MVENSRRDICSQQMNMWNFDLTIELSAPPPQPLPKTREWGESNEKITSTSWTGSVSSGMVRSSTGGSFDTWEAGVMMVLFLDVTVLRHILLGDQRERVQRL